MGKRVLDCCSRHCAGSKRVMTKAKPKNGVLVENDPKMKRYQEWLAKMNCKDAPVALAEFAGTSCRYKDS